jgi:hypothetical protein
MGGMEGMMKTAMLKSTDVQERCRRLVWRRQALAAGFAPAEASRLAFWRWYSARRGQTAQRMMPNGRT